jgi:DNA gyrase/topoisomerase IV subunit A
MGMRYLLVDGQGNFGSVDGDSQQQCVIQKQECVRFQKKYGRYRKETVDFQLNFDDDTLYEPKVITRFQLYY